MSCYCELDAYTIGMNPHLSRPIWTVRISSGTKASGLLFLFLLDDSEASRRRWRRDRTKKKSSSRRRWTTSEEDDAFGIRQRLLIQRRLWRSQRRLTGLCDRFTNESSKWPSCNAWLSWAATKIPNRLSVRLSMRLPSCSSSRSRNMPTLINYQNICFSPLNTYA